MNDLCIYSNGMYMFGRVELYIKESECSLAFAFMSEIESRVVGEEAHISTMRITMLLLMLFILIYYVCT